MLPQMGVAPMVAVFAGPVMDRPHTARRPRVVTTRPVAVYAPAGEPLWVTHDGRRQRVIAIEEQPQPAGEPRLPLLPAESRRLLVRLAGGSALMLLHSRRGAWAQETGA